MSCMQDLVPRPGIEPGPPALGVQSLTHWTTREVPECLIKLIYLFLAALGLCCCTQAFSSCGEQGLLFVVVSRLLIAVTSLAAEHGL